MNIRGSEAIKMAVKLAGGRQELAAKVGVSYKTILDWMSGRSGVSLQNALKIEKATEGQVNVKDILPGLNWSELR